jgi:hypothetical protein
MTERDRKKRAHPSVAPLLAALFLLCADRSRGAGHHGRAPLHDGRVHESPRRFEHVENPRGAGQSRPVGITPARVAALGAKTPKQETRCPGNSGIEHQRCRAPTKSERGNPRLSSPKGVAGGWGELEGVKRTTSASAARRERNPFQLPPPTAAKTPFQERKAEDSRTASVIFQDRHKRRCCPWQGLS